MVMSRCLSSHISCRHYHRLPDVLSSSIRMISGAVSLHMGNYGTASNQPFGMRTTCSLTMRVSTGGYFGRVKILALDTPPEL